MLGTINTFSTLKAILLLSMSTILLPALAGCTVIAAVDAVGSTAIGVTKGAVKVTGAVVGAAIPDGDDDDDKDDKGDKEKDS